MNDDDLVLDLVRRQLSHLSITLISTSSREALAAVWRMLTAVLLRNLRMPERDGIFECRGESDQRGRYMEYLAKTWEARDLERMVCEGLERYRFLSGQHLL